MKDRQFSQSMPVVDASNVLRFRVVEDDDIPHLLTLYNTLFPQTDRTASWWYWWYKDNPAGGSCQVLAETVEGRRLGMLAMAPVRLWCKDRIITVAQDSVGIVHPDFQGRGVFGTMANELHRIEAMHYVFQFCFCNERSCGAYQKNLGVKLEAIGSFYTRETSSHPDVAGLKLLRQKHFGTEHDRLWKLIRERLSVAQVRDSVYLNWRFADSRSGRSYISYDVLDDGGRVVGFLVLQPYLDKLDILDYCLLKGTGLGDPKVVISLLDQAAMENGIHRVSFWALDTHEELIGTLCESGFEKDTRLFYLLTSKFARNETTRILGNTRMWCYTAGDMELF